MSKRKKGGREVQAKAGASPAPEPVRATEGLLPHQRLVQARLDMQDAHVRKQEATIAALQRAGANCANG